MCYTLTVGWVEFLDLVWLLYLCLVCFSLLWFVVWVFVVCSFIWSFAGLFLSVWEFCLMFLLGGFAV